MSLTSLIPTLRGSGSRRAVDKVAELRDENVALLNRQAAADDFFAVLMNDVVVTNTALQQEQQLRGEAEEAAAQMRMERDEWRDRFLALQARFGPQLAAEENAARVAVPPMARIGCDQDTQSIDVTTLREAAEAGLLPGCGPGRLHAEAVAK